MESIEHSKNILKGNSTGLTKQKVFISGSKTISKLNDEFCKLLSEAVQASSEILIGDCNGVDALVQRYLANLNYKNVTIYCSGQKPRNYIDKSWKIHSCAELAMGLKGRQFYTVKDIEMSKDCDYGIALWDSKSVGTAENIKRLKDLGKNAFVINIQ